MIFNINTKYRFITEVVYDLANKPSGERFRVQYREWYWPFWRDLGVVYNAEHIAKLIKVHKHKITVL